MNVGYEKARAKLQAHNKRQHELVLENYNKNPVRCKQCEEKIPYKLRFDNVFCNSSCSARYNNARRLKRGLLLNCLKCGNPIGERHRTKFCSHPCSTEYTCEQSVREWLAGKRSGLNGTVVAQYVRRWLAKTRGEKCEHCGWCKVNPHTNKIPLNVDHIDGDYKNNDPKNLRFLCPSCHSLTPTYGSRNKGHGRPDKRWGLMRA